VISAECPRYLVRAIPIRTCPGARVLESAEQFTAMGAAVKTQHYPGRPHTVMPQEIKSARDLIFGSAQ